ncbi:endonuclease/exonuclease/phosphatase family protein [Streptomyces sp. NPDC059524]|uniref:endonuclease/exonuclease/phosphatase family protein n=1 Tax=Streptomyces sp. NPDC059524 TaxID=3346856 RepID=UPI0036C6B194
MSRSLGRGRPLAVVLCVLALLLLGPSAPGGTLVARPALPPGAPTAVVEGRVMTWNLCNPCGGPELAVGRATHIAAYAPQVIGFQEACARDVERIRAHLERLYGLRYHVAYGPVLRNWGRCGGLPWRAGGFGQAILSAQPMTRRGSVEYPDGGSEDRGYLAVTTEVGGRRVRVFDTHLAQRSQAPVRAGQVRFLAAAVSRYAHAIVLGDFNAVPGSSELRPMWKVARNAAPECGPSPTTDCATTTDWHSTFDYVFLRGIAARGHGVHPSRYSDHDAVHADLGPVPRTPPGSARGAEGDPAS